MQVPVDHTRDDEHAGTADDCVACHVRAAYNMLARSIEILWALALHEAHLIAARQVEGSCAIPYSMIRPIIRQKMPGGKC